MLKYLVIGGDSYAMGAELKDKNSRYYQLIANRFNYKLYDGSDSNLSNELISRHTINLVNELLFKKQIDPEEILVCVTFSFFDRINFFNKKSNSFFVLKDMVFVKKNSQPRPLTKWLEKLDDDTHLSDLEYYFKSHQSLIYFQYNLINIVYYLQCFLKQKNIKYVITFNSKNTYDLLNMDTSISKYSQEKIGHKMPSILLIQEDIDYNYVFDKFLDDFEYARGERYHPLEQAHYEYSDMFIDFIEKKIYDKQN